MRGFFRGLRAIFGGLAFVITRPSVWGWALLPVIVAGFLFLVAGAGAWWGAAALREHLVGADAGTWATIGGWVLEIVLIAVGAIVAFFVAMSLAQPLSGFALERIARSQELALGGRVWPDQPFGPSFRRSLAVSLTALAIGLPILTLLAFVTFVFPPAAVVTVPLKLIVTGLLAAYDLLDYPLSIRGIGVRQRLGFIRDNFGAVLGFGVGAALLLLIPGMGLLLLSFGVAGATRIVAQST